MDSELLRQSVSYHGHNLFSLLKCEQLENPGFKFIAGDVSKALNQRKERECNNVAVEQFIARKADLLFAPSWNSGTAVNYIQEETEDLYSIMPPLEQFMDIPFSERRDLFYRDIERGDIVIGRITSIREFGFFVTLICLGGGFVRDIEDLEIIALCPVRDVPCHGNHDDPLSYYQTGDLIRAGVKDIDRYHGKLTVSLHNSSISPHLSNLKLGVISVDDMPSHYSLSNNEQSYENVLEHKLGFANPSTVEFLLGKLGISEEEPPTLMRGLQSKFFLGEDYGTFIRKKQSASWALKCVKIGVDHFKSGHHVEAMNEYNKALEIDLNNVEALVARGALYATKGSLTKAIDDFELALESCPTHRNAKKYLCQTLVERGGQLEAEEKLVTAEGLYRKALTLDESFQEADEALKRIQLHIQKTLKLKEEEEASKEKEKSKSVETSAEKLRKILKEEKRMKRKKRRASSSSTSSSSDSSSSGRRKAKKKKQKRYRHKKHSHRISSHEDKSFDGKEEWCPPPVNTSASFLNQNYEVTKLLKEQDRPVDCKSQAKDRWYHRSMSLSSVEILDDGGGRSEEESFHSAPLQSESSKGKDCSGENKYYLPSKCNLKSSDRKSSGREREVVKFPQRMDDGNIIQQDFNTGSEKKRHRKYSSSSAGSEYSRKSDRYIKTKDCSSQGYSYSRSESSRYDSVETGNRKSGLKIEEEMQGPRSERDESQSSTGRSENGKESAEGNVKKNLPSNLLDIFSQIAQFEREKSIKQKK
ncbi:tetratricopeptide repeat protein 14 isoform X1 [Lepisosteus oculatus]|uniref:tetratricopeptide repeat protein 14 isoform X1 n=1 Tax=Lepisosteus oculatus TaxID=7918 RepID=UPI0035F52EFF